MASSDNLTGIYIALAVYFALLSFAAFNGFFKMRRHRHQQEELGKTEDVLEAHYLGGRDFGPFLTAGSLFASFFSGYTVVGVPTEAFFLGWISLRWMVATVSIVFSMMAIGARLRKIGIVRNHQSPVDIATDRYQSHVFRYTIVFYMLVPMIIFLTAQLVAIKSTFNALFGINPDSNYAVIIISAIIVIFEWLGGLSSVALTDCIQGFIMVACFLTLPIVIAKNYGGWQDLDWEVYPIQSHYQTPSKNDQWMFWNFVFLLFGAGIQPHAIQRIYAAKDMKSLKVGYSVLALGPWLTSLAGVFMGTMGVKLLIERGIPVTSPFANMLDLVMDLGGFPYVVGVVASTATLASIMSTADSVLIAVSQVLTSEVVVPNFPNIKGSVLANVGRFTSFVSLLAALLMTMYGGEGISELIVLQVSISVHGMPGFFLAMFGTKKWDCHPWVASFAAFAGLGVYLALYFAEADEEIPMSPGLLGILMNLAMMITLEAARRLYVNMRSKKKNAPSETAVVTSEGKGVIKDDEEGIPVKNVEETEESEKPWMDMSVPAWDSPDVSKFGSQRLTSDFIWKSMENIREPVTEPWFVILVLAFSVLSTPITAGSSPAIGENGLLVSEPGVTFGIPAWAARVIVTMIPTTLFLLYAISVMPNNLFPEDDSESDSEEEEDSTENDKMMTMIVKEDKGVDTEKLDRSMATQQSSFSTMNEDVTRSSRAQESLSNGEDDEQPVLPPPSLKKKKKKNNTIISTEEDDGEEIIEMQHESVRTINDVPPPPPPPATGRKWPSMTEYEEEMINDSVRAISPPPPSSRRKWGSTGLAAVDKQMSSPHLKRISSKAVDKNNNSNNKGGGRNVPSVQE